MNNLTDLIIKRRSIRSFSAKALEDPILHRMLDAARWAPSAFNGQPWRFIIGKKGEENYTKIFNALYAGNKSWADSAPVLMVAVANSVFDRDGKENKHAWYETGMAVAQLTLKALENGIFVHQMAGFDPKVISDAFNLPENLDPVTVIALGYAEESQTSTNLKQTQPTRKSVEEILISGQSTIRRAS